MPNAIRTVCERAAASRKLNQKSTSTTIAIPISMTALLPKRPNAPWTLRSYVHLKKFGMIVRHAGTSGKQRLTIRCFVYWSAQSTAIAAAAMTSVCFKLKIRLRYKLIEPSCDVEECIVNENQADDDEKCTRSELDCGQRRFDAGKQWEDDADAHRGCEK